MDNSSAAPTLWFDSQNLVEQVDYQTWTRGQKLFLYGKVLRHEVRRDGVSWVVTGAVQGTQVKPYTVQVEVTLDPKNRLVDWYATCSCPVGVACKHAVALTLKAGTSGLRVGGMVVPAQTSPTSPPAPVAQSSPMAQPSPMARMEAARQLAQELHAQQAENVADKHLLDWLGKLQATQVR
ncbi:MAG: SWIM zinc finger family protein, partial [Hydrogenophaga sp.]|nr:SWIM zinc finger family protein [Hydrogenophaga sp.]